MLWLALSMIVHPSRRNVRMPEPFLHQVWATFLGVTLASRSSFSRQARTGFCLVLVMGSLLLGREGGQNVTLVLGLHRERDLDDP